jgi:hypothetical protein
MYVELNTKITTQPITQYYNDEPTTGYSKSALTSIYSIFAETRLILKEYGLEGKQFASLAFEMFVCICNFFIFIHCAYPFLVVQFLYLVL